MFHKLVTVIGILIVLPWISDFVNFPYDLQDELMYMNDEKRFSFSAIADYIEENRNKIINRQEPSERPDRTD